MRQPSISFMLVLSLFSSAFTSCGYSKNKKEREEAEESEQVQVASETIRTSRKTIIMVDDLVWDRIPSRYREQVDGAGCGYRKISHDNAFCINGLVKINGKYEMLKYSDRESNEYAVVYQNSDWKVVFKKDPSSVERFEGGSTFFGEATAVAKADGGSVTIAFQGGCGC